MKNDTELNLNVPNKNRTDHKQWLLLVALLLLLAPLLKQINVILTNLKVVSEFSYFFNEPTYTKTNKKNMYIYIS